MQRTRTIVRVTAWLLMAAMAWPQEVVDQIVATVNGHPILESDWVDEIRWEAFSAGRKLKEVRDADKRAALERLIDQELVREQMTLADLAKSDPSRVDAKVKELRDRVSAGKSEGTWTELLTTYGLKESDVADHVGRQLMTLAFIDLRLRPTVHVGERAIQNYYRDKFVPELKEKQVEVPPLARVRAKISEVLTQTEIEETFNVWLHNIRQQSQIRVGPPGAERGQR